MAENMNLSVQSELPVVSLSRSAPSTQSVPSTQSAPASSMITVASAPANAAVNTVLRQNNSSNLHLTGVIQKQAAPTAATTSIGIQIPRGFVLPAGSEFVCDTNGTVYVRTGNQAVSSQPMSRNSIGSMVPIKTIALSSRSLAGTKVSAPNGLTILNKVPTPTQMSALAQVSGSSKVSAPAKVLLPTQVSAPAKVSALTQVSAPAKVSALTQVSTSAKVSALTQVSTSAKVSALTQVSTSAKVSALTHVPTSNAASTSGSSLSTHLLQATASQPHGSSINTNNDPVTRSLAVQTGHKPNIIGAVATLKLVMENLLQKAKTLPVHSKVKDAIEYLLVGALNADEFNNKLKECNLNLDAHVCLALQNHLANLRMAVSSNNFQIKGLPSDWLTKRKRMVGLQMNNKQVRPVVLGQQIQGQPRTGVPLQQRAPVQLRIPLQLISSQQGAVLQQRGSLPPDIHLLQRQQRPIVIRLQSRQLSSLSNGVPCTAALAPRSLATTHILSNMRQPTPPPLTSKPTPSSSSSSASQKLALPLLTFPHLHQMLVEKARCKGLKKYESSVLQRLSGACEEMMHAFLASCISAAEHRTDTYSANKMYVPEMNVRANMKFLESLDQAEKKRKDDKERAVLKKAAKDRNKTCDPVKEQLKQKGRAMCLAESEALDFERTNLAALKAIGSRKRKIDLSASLDKTATDSSVDMTFQIPQRVRLKRITLRDVQYVAEMDQHLSQTLPLFRSYIG